MKKIFFIVILFYTLFLKAQWERFSFPVEFIDTIKLNKPYIMNSDTFSFFKSNDSIMIICNGDTITIDDSASIDGSQCKLEVIGDGSDTVAFEGFILSPSSAYSDFNITDSIVSIYLCSK